MHNFPTIRLVANQSELDRLKAEALSDNHRPIRPTHIFWKGEEIVGYASICALVPLVPNGAAQEVQFHTWFHTAKLGPRDSFNLINALENIMRCCCPTAKTAIVPVALESPFTKVMESMDYRPLMDTRLWGRVLA